MEGNRAPQKEQEQTEDATLIKEPHKKEQGTDPQQMKQKNNKWRKQHYRKQPSQQAGITRETEKSRKTTETRTQKTHKGEKRETATETTRVCDHQENTTEYGNGIRTLNIAGLNPDSTKEPQTQQETTNELTKNKIRIDMI